MKRFYNITFSVLLAVSANLYAQEKPYEEVANERAAKIVLEMDFSDPAKGKKAQELIANQYIGLNAIHSRRDQQIQKSEAKAGEIKAKADEKVARLHERFVNSLSATFNENQVEGIKNGMTYNTVPITYANYLLMLPYSTEEQRQKILIFLKEGREKAMDGGSAKEKHAWFNKYKGKIANYLASEGYDLKEEGNKWAKRRDLKSADMEITSSNKIMQALSLNDRADKETVRNLIAYQYQKIAEIQNSRDKSLEEIKSAGLAKKELEDREIATWTKYKSEVDAQRSAFLEKLSLLLNKEQVELLKNEMTAYGLKKEFDKFQALLPGMNDAQKEKVYNYLLEARENAMNVLTGKERNQWFAKYRGRANNYLSAQGYDLRKATEELERKQAAE